MESIKGKIIKISITPTPNFIWKQIVWDYVITCLNYKGRKVYVRGRCDTEAQVGDLLRKIAKQNAHEFPNVEEGIDRYAEP